MTLQEQLRQIDQLKAEIEALRPLTPELERRIMDKFRLDWTYHSNAIEGNTLTYGETKAFLLHGITAAGKPFRDYLDIKGHHAALDTLQEIIRHDRALTEADVRELHKIILVEPYRTPAMTPDGALSTRLIQPGQYKTTPNHVQTSTGEIHYYATPEETPARMGDLMAWYRREWEEKQLHPLILAATFHYRFVIIHPFDDGNGRMSRLLMNLIFMQAGFPPVIIPKEIKNDYLLALEKADADNDLEPFIELVGKQLIASMNLYLRGANGGDVGDLNDLDKKLGLLQKQMEASQEDRPEKNAQLLQTWYRNVTKPFLELLFQQLVKFNRFFTSTKLWPKNEVNDNAFTLTVPDITEFFDSLMPFYKTKKRKSAYKLKDSVDYDVSPAIDFYKYEIDLFSSEIDILGLAYEWDDFKTDKDFHITLNLVIKLKRFGFEVYYSLETTPLKGLYPFEMAEFISLISQKPNQQLLLSGNYNLAYSDIELRKYVSHVTDDIYRLIQQKVGG